MPRVKNVEKKVWDIEDFAIRILWNGKDVRSDFKGISQYEFERMAKNEMTVATWKENRFYPIYQGYDVEVLDGDGENVPGNTKLGTVRDTYIEE